MAGIKGMNAIPYDETIADAVCDAISSESKGLAAIITQLEYDISPSLIYKWIQQNESFRERYARAKAEQALVLADEITEIADNTQAGEIITEKGDGTVETKHADMLEHRKLRIESRKWLAAKLLPKVYGDKTALTNASGDGPAELIIKHIGSDGE
jgi:transposase-like protein